MPSDTLISHSLVSGATVPLSALPLATHLVPPEGDLLGRMPYDARTAASGGVAVAGQWLPAGQACGGLPQARYHRLLHAHGRQLPQLVKEKLRLSRARAPQLGLGPGLVQHCPGVLEEAGRLPRSNSCSSFLGTRTHCNFSSSSCSTWPAAPPRPGPP